MTQGPVDLTPRVADVVQYIVGVGIAALLAFAYQVNGRLRKIETLLIDPNSGLLPTMTMLRQRTHELGDKIHATEGKLALTDLRAEELDKRVVVLEDRRRGPKDRRRPPDA